MNLGSTRRGGGLTLAERTTVELLIRGLSSAEVALTRGVSLYTVSNQVSSAYRKLGIGSRRELRAGTVPPLLASRMDSGVRLSAREHEILSLADRGLANKVIADAVGVGLSTVSTLLTRARRKLRAAPEA